MGRNVMEGSREELKMGVMKEGKVSGLVPNTEAFAVNYPGYPSSISKALDTLGGLQAIQKARDLQSNRLELRFRAQDPYSHPTIGDLRPCHRLLLKISKTNKARNNTNTIITNTPSESGSVASDEPLSANIVARFQEAYHFDGMVDYQHVVAVHADVARTKRKAWLELHNQPSEKSGCTAVEEEDVMILLPPLFALKDIPENLVLRPSVALSSKRNQEAVVQPDLEIDMEPVLAIDFNIKEIPRRINWEDYIPRGSDQWELQMAVSELFDKRPICVKHSINECLRDKGYNILGHMLRRLLSRVAYYFSSGPFLRFWIKKGYDPRKDPDSCIYQRIDFRVHPSLRSYCDANTAKQGNQRWEEICAFRVFPFKCQISLQLYELADEYIQQEIKKPPSQKTCTYSTGWFTNATLDSFRQRITMRFLSIYPKPGAERLLKEATEHFEKAKRRRVNDHVILNEDENQEVDAEVICGIDVEEPSNVEDEDDENEEENDEEADDEISLESHSHANTESIAGSRLQELFGGFPSVEATTQNAESSDEEYQILEQDSDDDDKYGY